MATKLTKAAIGRSIDHLAKYGDTDIFPHLPELVFLKQMKSQIVLQISALDLDSYEPIQSLETIAPKSRYGFRTVNQLSLLDTLLFTAAVIEIGSDLEKIRRPVNECGPFSYRFEKKKGASLFQEKHTYKDWIQWQKEHIHSNSYSNVIVTDIADYFQRINLHRIENCLDTATGRKGINKFIRKLIKIVRSRQSYGIPVGGAASRLIAESVLADSDNALIGEGYAFSRFADDYRIFTKNDQPTYSTLAFLAEQLAANEGLSLNVQKTRILTSSEFLKHLDENMSDVFDKATQAAFEALSHALYFDEEPSEKDVQALQSLNLIEILEEEIDKDLWDFGKIRAIFRALRLTLQEQSVTFLIEKFELFVPFVKEMVLFFDAIKDNVPLADTGLAEKVIAEIRTGAAASVPTIRVWLLELFVRGVLPIDNVQLSAISRNETLENRQMFLIRGIKKDVNHFRLHKTKFEEKNNFEKTAFILSATCLPKDEFTTWLSAIKPNMTRPLDRLFCDWAKTKQNKLAEVFNTRSKLARE